MRGTPEERFWEKVRKSDGCWEWLAHKNRGGYGQFTVDGRQVCAHRWAYEHFVRPILSDLVCDHLCRNSGCVNPAHIELVPQKENVLRGVGLTAQNARQTTCKNGHPLGAPRRGRRVCPTCARARTRAWRVANREKSNAYKRAWAATNRERVAAQRRASREKYNTHRRTRYAAKKLS